jgi:hypothetical protein
MLRIGYTVCTGIGIRKTNRTRVPKPLDHRQEAGRRWSGLSQPVLFRRHCYRKALSDWVKNILRKTDLGYGRPIVAMGVWRRQPYIDRIRIG